MIWMCFCSTRLRASDSATTGSPPVSAKYVTMWWPLTLLPKTLSPRFHPCCSCFPATAAVPVSGSSYPTAIVLPGLAELAEPPVLLELQAASTSGVASRSASVPYRAGMPRTLMTISFVGPPPKPLSPAGPGCQQTVLQVINPITYRQRGRSYGEGRPTESAAYSACQVL